MKKKETVVTDTEFPVSLKMIEAINDYGTVKISEKVVTSVVKKAACKVSGVTRLASGGFVDSITNIFRPSNTPDGAVKLDIKGHEVKVHLKVNVEYGQNIPEVAMRIQNTITDELKLITGMDVTKVDVEIQEVEVPAID